MILTIALMMELRGSFIGLHQKVRGELQSVGERWEYEMYQLGYNSERKLPQAKPSPQYTAGVRISASLPRFSSAGCDYARFI